ncbi:putative deoxyribonuclease TATDN3 [Sapajus apella]|uniref:Deoxyribonuclease TATDN3 n=1 Tax=Sapajus apella TaxID=9515 RepID=A0A6J3ITU9_SAPAP|nr:putative deoxyribonuclease TATDN3 [Sapajus apella]
MAGKGLVDCHCHLSAPDFDRDLDDVLEKAKKANVVALVAVAEHSGEFEKIMQLSERYNGFVLPCLGVHPVQGLLPEDQRSVTLKLVPQPSEELGLQKQKLVKQLPLTSICLETDSPALGPEKQVRNEPWNISISAEYIAQVKGISVEEVIEVTTQNTLKLFPKLPHLLQK